MALLSRPRRGSKSDLLNRSLAGDQFGEKYAQHGDHRESSVAQLLVSKVNGVQVRAENKGKGMRCPPLIRPPDELHYARENREAKEACDTIRRPEGTEAVWSAFKARQSEEVLGHQAQRGNHGDPTVLQLRLAHFEVAILVPAREEAQGVEVTQRSESSDLLTWVKGRRSRWLNWCRFRKWHRCGPAPAARHCHGWFLNMELPRTSAKRCRCTDQRRCRGDRGGPCHTGCRACDPTWRSGAAAQSKSATGTFAKPRRTPTWHHEKLVLGQVASQGENPNRQAQNGARLRRGHVRC
mmetsp:Transcript_104334/g.293749  ORF Transcript_104334/g.293749 Transcript_104334/m.293749 type:complete len:295 (-) Transcript_104334:63-947(-)